MSLADLAASLKTQRRKKAGRRLFDYVTKARAYREVLPLQVGDSFRASSLPYLCPREEILASRYDIIRAERVKPTLEITWTIGHTFHDLYRDVYYGPMQEWAGAWECIRCGWDTDTAGVSQSPVFKEKLVSKGHIATMPRECGGCGAPFWGVPDGERVYGTFKEWSIEDKVIGLKGHPDGWSVRNGADRVLVDLKSHGATGFSSRTSLRNGHNLQVWGYEHMCGDRDGEVWYMNKSPWGDAISFVRDIRVPFDKKEFKNRVVEPLREVHEGVAGGPITDRKCINPECVIAKECQLVDVCFEA